MPVVDITPPLPICNTMPVPPIPTLPPGITLAAALPPVVGPPLDVKLCCKIVQLTPGIAFPPIAFQLNSGLIATINGKLREINTYLRALPVRCPREL